MGVGGERSGYPGRLYPDLGEIYDAALEISNLYRIIPDTQAEAHGYLRVVDESGEDYGYAADRFLLSIYRLR